MGCFVSRVRCNGVVVVGGGGSVLVLLRTTPEASTELGRVSRRALQWPASSTTLQTGGRTLVSYCLLDYT